MDNNIKTGSKIICIDNTAVEELLTKGAEYTALYCRDALVEVNTNSGKKLLFVVTRFKVKENNEAAVENLATSTVMSTKTWAQKINPENNTPPQRAATGGLKYDGNKPPIDLVPREAIEAAARAFGYGAKKYASHNFKKGITYSRLSAAVMRHLLAYMDNENQDEESGLSHLDHAMSALSMLVYMSANKPEMDDRFNKATLKLNNEDT